MFLSAKRLVDIGMIVLVTVTVFAAWLGFHHDPSRGVEIPLTTPGGAYFVMGILVTPELLFYALFRRSMRIGLASLVPILVGYSIYVLMY